MESHSVKDNNGKDDYEDPAERERRTAEIPVGTILGELGKDLMDPDKADRPVTTGPQILNLHRPTKSAKAEENPRPTGLSKSEARARLMNAAGLGPSSRHGGSSASSATSGSQTPSGSGGSVRATKSAKSDDKKP